MADTDTSSETLFVDILNQFAYSSQREPFDQISAIQEAIDEINIFVDASKSSNYKIIGFIDKSISTEETFRKWSDRRIQEINDKNRKKRNYLVNTPLLLGEEFKKLGVPVHYSTIDCDDTIAAFAYHRRGNVLSADKDFFRYYLTDSDRSTSYLGPSYHQNRPFKVFKGYEIDQAGFLRLEELKGKCRVERRKILEKCPKTRDTANFLTTIPDFMAREAGGAKLMFRRGCGSTLTTLTNPHIQVRHLRFDNVVIAPSHFSLYCIGGQARPLRQALYWRMESGPVLEVVANWHEDPDKIIEKEIVQPDHKLDHLLDKPGEAFRQIFGGCQRPSDRSISELDWRNHVFCQKTVIAELCTWTCPANYTKILFEI